MSKKTEKRINELTDEINDIENEISEKDVAISGVEFEMNDIDPDDCENDFDNFIDEMYSEIKLFGVTYYASRILSEVDPTNYRQQLLNYVCELDITQHPDYQDLESERDELNDEIECLESDRDDLQEKLDELECE